MVGNTEGAPIKTKKEQTSNNKKAIKNNKTHTKKTLSLTTKQNHSPNTRTESAGGGRTMLSVEESGDGEVDGNGQEDASE